MKRPVIREPLVRDNKEQWAFRQVWIDDGLNLFRYRRRNESILAGLRILNIDFGFIWGMFGRLYSFRGLKSDYGYTGRNWYLFKVRPWWPGTWTYKFSCPRGSRTEICNLKVYSITYMRRSKVTESSWSEISKQVVDSSNSTIAVSYINQETPLRHFEPANSGRSTTSSSLLFENSLSRMCSSTLNGMTNTCPYPRLQFRLEGRLLLIEKLSCFWRPWLFRLKDFPFRLHICRASFVKEWLSDHRWLFRV